ncbi:MAG: mitochondrial fission ELM1 family protein [Pseudomonadota bacterium]
MNIAAPLTCLVVSDGRRGIENQALGLAEAVAALTPMRIETRHVARTGAIESPEGPPPDVWIGCGRAAVRAAPRHKRAWPNARFVYVQDPKAHRSLFDLIIAPSHDRLRGETVVNLIGSPNRITPDRLKDAAKDPALSGPIEALEGPRAAVLIGGDSKRHRFTDEVGAYLLERLEGVLDQGASLMITPSRRTPDSFTAALKARFASEPRVLIHDGREPNPYFAWLARADWLFVTEDSTNMLCEAASTGTPVYRLSLDGRPGKFAALYEALEASGAVRPWLGELQRWTYAPLHETERAARRVLEILR